MTAEEFQAAQLELQSRHTAAVEKEADQQGQYVGLVYQQMEVLKANSAILQQNATAFARQATAMEQQVANTQAIAQAAAAPMPASQRDLYLVCLRVAAEARMENEPAPLLKAADSLLAGINQRFPT